MINFSKKVIFKQITATILFIVFSSIAFNSLVLANLNTTIQIGTAGVRLPVALIANYYDYKNETKKSLMWDSCYRAICILDTALKVFKSSDYKKMAEKDFFEVFEVSLLEIGLSLYDLYYITRNIKEIRALNIVVNNKNLEQDCVAKRLQASKVFGSFYDENKNEAGKLKKGLYALIKSSALFLDSFSSVQCGLAEGPRNGDYRRYHSWISACSRVLASCFDNKKGEIDSKVIATLAALGIVVAFRQSPDCLSFLPENDVDDQSLGDDLSGPIKRFYEKHEPKGKDKFDEAAEILVEKRRHRPTRYVHPPQRYSDSFVSSANLSLPSRTKDAQLKDIPYEVGLEQLCDILKTEKLGKCSICLEDIGVDDDHRDIVIADGCHHVFCRQGLGRWAKKNPIFDKAPTCPYCRKPITGVASITIEDD